MMIRQLMKGTTAIVTLGYVQGYEGGLRILQADAFGNETMITNTTLNETLVVPKPPENDPPPQTLPDVPPPSNDQCMNAEGPLSVSAWSTNTALPLITSGTTIGATTMGQDGLPSCGGRSTSPGVWYYLQGTGQEIAVSTCSEATQIDSVVSVYNGSCGTLSCVGSNDDAAAPYQCEAHQYASRVSFLSQPGVMYYILVRSFNPTRPDTFDLAVGGSPQDNYICQAAHPLEVGAGPVAGDTSKAPENDLPQILDYQCGYSEGDYGGEFAHLYAPRLPRGLWYEVMGTGGRLRATTCKVDQGAMTTFYAHRINIFEGDCFNCIGGDTNPRSCVTVEWDTAAGVKYYLVIHRTYEAGATQIPIAPFELTVSEVSVASVSRKNAGGDLFD